ncbi:phytoene/squalene synthase family protein [Telmatospirillum sp. J64-1]|uniref:phytoene/squalene synthase family protein n=1 Tax=Telmatospirillum sp. J64-1 TaxID=2502183 RepID=UPI00115E8D7F|nr:phytoene/squalene synthase family protein [Telmatospirillum sp. J64-1]
MPPEDELSFPAREVKRYDRERFLTAQFAPAECREDLFALYAFNLEIAKLREVVTEPMMGMIRLQWWREGLEEIYGGGQPRRQPVMEALARAISRHKLTRGHFDRLLDTRERDLDEEAPPNLEALEDYAEGSSATLTALAIEILSGQDEAAQQAGRHVGIAWALVGLLRAVPFHAAADRLYLPLDLLAEAGVHSRDILAGKPRPELSKAVEQVAARARFHLDLARSLRPRVPRSALPALLPAVLARRHLARLEKSGFDVFDPVLVSAQPPVLRLTLSALLGRY